MFKSTLIACGKHTDNVFAFSQNDQTTVTCNVHFGVPGGQGDCVQIGICRVIIDAVPTKSELARENRRCRQAAATIAANADGGIDMFFAQEDIMPCTERAIFRNKWLPVPVACSLPTQLQAQLGDSVPQKIATGQYPITRVAGGYVISF